MNTKPEKVPYRLFHYTSMEGLLGIIKDKSIWASNISYLNDASELNYAVNLLTDLLEARITIQAAARPAGLLSTLSVLQRPTGILSALSAMRAPEDPEVSLTRRVLNFVNHILTASSFKQGLFVCSFSEKGDLLSQWRGYCTDNAGFSFGFRHSWLKQVAERENPSFGLTLERCIYNKKEQDRRINALIDQSFAKSNPKDEQESIGQVAADLLRDFITLAPTLKHQKFAEEKEWRLVARPRQLMESIHFRPGKSMIIPFVKVPLPQTDGKELLIDKIVVGPTHDRLLSKIAVEMLLLTNNAKKGWTVAHSTIPYRNW